MTNRAISTVRVWASNIPVLELPNGEDVNTYKQRAVQYMLDHDSFVTEDFVNTVVRDEDQLRKAQFVTTLTDALAEKGVAGQQFSPKPNSISKRVKKSIYETQEGVKIEFEGDALDNRVEIKRRTADQLFDEIVIRTSSLRTKSE